MYKIPYFEGITMRIKAYLAEAIVGGMVVHRGV